MMMVMFVADRDALADASEAHQRKRQQPPANHWRVNM